MDDKTLRQEIIDELDWEPSVDAAHIGVAVEAGVVTLTGHVGSYAEKVAAERAVRRIAGVKAIAQEIEVRYAADKKTADDQIAKRVLDVIAWTLTTPESSIKVQVQKGWVTLSGTVDWWYQKVDAENAVRKLSGVTAVSNDIVVRPRLQASDLKQRIEKALKRRAERESDGIRVLVDGGKVTLEGKVKGWRDRDLIERTAWSAPGVTAVDDRIAVL